MGKIIVLEDNTLFAEVVCRWLQREGWKTECVTNISRAKKLMEKADTDDENHPNDESAQKNRDIFRIKHLIFPFLNMKKQV